MADDLTMLARQYADLRLAATENIIKKRVEIYGTAGVPDEGPANWLAKLTIGSGTLAQCVLEEQDAIYRDEDREEAASIRKQMIEAATYHAALALAFVESLLAHTCRACGCSDDMACEGGCYWVEPGLCSSCVKPEAT